MEAQSPNKKKEQSERERETDSIISMSILPRTSRRTSAIKHDSFKKERVIKEVIFEDGDRSSGGMGGRSGCRMSLDDDIQAAVLIDVEEEGGFSVLDGIQTHSAIRKRPERSSILGSLRTAANIQRAPEAL
jgi:hypothetical protein